MKEKDWSFLKAAVFGNVTLDVLCYPVDNVPRNNSISFERSAISPGGCGSNVAIGLRALGIDTLLVARIGDDLAGDIDLHIWEEWGIDCRFVKKEEHMTTGVSIGLVDHGFQPRFIHTSGANAKLTTDHLDFRRLIALDVRWLHIAGFYVLPGLLDGRLGPALKAAGELGMRISLDVVESPRMRDASHLWPCLPYLDIFLCNQQEAQLLTEEVEPLQAAAVLHSHGAKAVIIKAGALGCWLSTAGFSGEPSIQTHIPAVDVQVMDTTGAGDAFAAGLVAAILNDESLLGACRAANQAGARMVTSLGAVSGWSKKAG
jgi:sugar/nucleoside kinase (ribokinase family)